MSRRHQKTNFVKVYEIKSYIIVTKDYAVLLFFSHIIYLTNIINIKIF